MRIILLFICLAIGFTSVAQDLTGIWRGSFESEGNRMMSDPANRYKSEVQLGQKDKLFTGVTYSYKTTEFYGKASAYGAINPKTKKVFLEETKILEVRSVSGGACIMTCFLQYSKVGNEEILEGHYTSMSTADSTQCGKGTVYLRKVETSDFYKEPFLSQKNPLKILPKTKPAAPPVVKSNPPVKSNSVPKNNATPPQKTTAKPKPAPPAKPAPPLASSKKPEVVKSIPEDSIKKITGRPSDFIVPRVLSTRENELVKTITTSANNISIKIYDNGTIDNDTVTVYVDKKPVILKARLTEKAIVVNLTLDSKISEHELVMVADNLGEIPPNTSLMIVNAGDEQYEVRITSTEQKNAVVLFKYERRNRADREDN